MREGSSGRKRWKWRGGREGGRDDEEEEEEEGLEEELVGPLLVIIAYSGHIVEGPRVPVVNCVTCPNKARARALSLSVAAIRPPKALLMFTGAPNKVR